MKIKVENKRAETDSAWLISFMLEDKLPRSEWFPKKHCKLENDILTVPKWLYDKKFSIIIKINEL